MSEEQKVLTKEIAEEFIKEDSLTVLEEFTEITDDAAEILSKFEGDLFLGGLTALSDAAAESLAKHPNLAVNEDVEALISKYRK